MPHPTLILHPNLIPQQNLRPRPALPPSVPGGGEHEFAGRVDVDGAEDAAAVAGDDGEGDGGAVAGRGGRGGEVVDAEDVLAGAGRGVSGNGVGREGLTIYQTKCRLLGILLTAYTGPEPCWNLKALSGLPRLLPSLWIEYSSTAQFRLPT